MRAAGRVENGLLRHARALGFQDLRELLLERVDRHGGCGISRGGAGAADGQENVPPVPSSQRKGRPSVRQAPAQRPVSGFGSSALFVDAPPSTSAVVGSAATPPTPIGTVTPTSPKSSLPSASRPQPRCLDSFTSGSLLGLNVSPTAFGRSLSVRHSKAP